jgi:hypothetical protein
MIGWKIVAVYLLPVSSRHLSRQILPVYCMGKNSGQEGYKGWNEHHMMKGKRTKSCKCKPILYPM